MEKMSQAWARVLLAAFFVLLSFDGVRTEAAPAQWSDDMSCCIEISTESNHKTTGEELRLYCVGVVDPESPSLSFRLSEAFLESGVNLQETDTAAQRKMIETLCRFIRDQEVLPQNHVVIDASGSAQVKVAPGLYLIDQPTAIRSHIQSSLVSAPQVNLEGPNWTDHIKVQLKAAPIEETVSTGDEEKPGVYLIISIGAATCLLILIWFRKKRQSMPR